MNNIKIAFIGGDKRMLCCAENCGMHGFECALYGFDSVSDRASSTRCASIGDCLMNSSAVVLPLPVSRDGVTVNSRGTVIHLCDVFEKCPEEVPVFAGSVPEKVRELAREHGREIYDYYNDEVLTEKNALATAEGAVMLAMQNSERTLYGSQCLVCGYGRIGRHTARLMKGLGSHVTVWARRKLSRTAAELDGFAASCVLEKTIQGSEFIFNTVPANIFTEKELSKMSGSQIYIELASPPYGIDKAAGARYNIETVDGSSLPLRYCPESAGGYIAEKLICEFERSGLL